ncbi:hypothetical protein G9P44_001723 [Scheffersomyces stipitis]|nr:hypothetical protein G9P44_001723 [Scheffersomyces stipitis]
MSSIPEIPGYYYDGEKRRYFKIVNGAVNSSSETKKYHNNAVEKEKRRLKYQNSRQESSLANSSSSQGSSSSSSSSPHTIAVEKSVEERRKILIKHTKEWHKSHTCPVLNLNNNSLWLRIKSGDVDVNNPYYVLDQTDLIRSSWTGTTPEKDERDALPQGTVEAQVNSSVMLMRNHDTWSSFRLYDFEEKRMKSLPDRSIETYLEQHGCIPADDLYAHNATGHTDSFQLLRIVETDISDFNWLFSFKTVFVDKEAVDNTRALLKFVYDKIQSQPPKVRQHFTVIFGLPLMTFDETFVSVDEMNNLLRSSESQEARSAALSAFLHRHEKDKTPFFEGSYLNPDSNYITHCLVTEDNSLVVVSDHYVVSISYIPSVHGTIEFKEFSCVHHKDIGSGEISQVFYDKQSIQLVKSSAILIFQVGDLSNGTGRKVKYETISKNYIPGRSAIYKLFLLGPGRYLSITSSKIYIYDHGSRHSMLVGHYFNDNNPRQFFLLSKDHLIINETEHDFRIFNLNRAHNNEAVVKIDFHYLKPGWFKDFYLANMVSMHSPNSRLKLGFSFLDSDDEQHSIFESHYI